MFIRNFVWVTLAVLSYYFQRIEFLYAAAAILVIQLLIYAYIITESKHNTYCRARTSIREVELLMFIMAIVYIQLEFINTIYLVIAVLLVVAFYFASYISFRIHKKRLSIDSAFHCVKDYPTRDDLVQLLASYKAPRWVSRIPLSLGNIKISITYGIQGNEFIRDTFYYTEGFEKTYNLKFKYRGIYQAGIKMIEIEDTLGFFYFKRENKLETVKIYPKMTELHYKKNASYLGIYENQELLSRTGDKFDLREFTNSDSTKYINWRIFAKKQELYVKDPELTSYVGNRTIFFDNRVVSNESEHQLQVTEEMFETLLSLMYTVQRGKEEQTLYYHNEDGRLDKHTYKLHRFNTIKEEVSFIPFVDDMKTSSIFDLEEAIKLNYRNSEIVFITSKLDDQMRALITRYNKSQVKLRVLYVCPYKGKKDIIAEETKLRRLGVTGLVVSLNNLEAVRNEVLL